MVKAMSVTESFLYTAGQIFGSKNNGPTKDLKTVDDMQAFARMING